MRMKTFHQFNLGHLSLHESKLKAPYAIFLDHENNIIVYDKNFIRKIDVSNSKIQTLIGGGEEIRNLSPSTCGESSVTVAGHGDYTIDSDNGLETGAPL